MLQVGERGKTVYKKIKDLKGSPISRAAYYAWKKEWDAGRGIDAGSDDESD